MKQVLIFIMLLFACPSFAAAPYNDWWQKANSFYDLKEYDSAVSYYERITALDPAEAQVYYNLGNAYYRLNDIAHAVLNYERALRLAPADKNIQDNLALTQTRISNRIYAAQDIFFVKWWRSITASTQAGLWAALALALFLILIGTAIAKQLKRSAFALPPQLTGIGWGICLLFLFFAFVAARNKHAHNKAVVMENDSPFYVSPQQTKAQAYIPEGTTVQFAEEKQGWAEVILPDGREGWMQLSVLNKV